MDLTKSIFRISFIVCTMVCLVLAGCHSEEATIEDTMKAKQPRIGVLLYRADDAYIASVCRSLEKTLAGKADVFVGDGQNEKYVQDEQLGSLLLEGVDALAVNLVDLQSASSLVDKIKRANIPVVFFNREPSLDDIKTYNQAYFVGTIPQAAGRMQGDIIHQLWTKYPALDRNGDGFLQYIMFQAHSDNPESLARTEFSVRRARELGVQMTQVGNTFMGGWDEERSYNLIRPVLPLIIDSTEIVIANNDAMALGVIRALQEMGYNTAGKDGKYIPVIGVDATEQGMEAIVSGAMTATVKQDSELMGRTIATLLLNAVHGVPVLQDIDLDWDESGIALRIPYRPIGEE